MPFDREQDLLPRSPVAAAPRAAVIGAGIAGLTCARTLRDAGWEVTVFDKGRRVGGRASARMTGPGRDLQFDHGAQYFTVKDDRFGRVLEAWLDRGVVAPWTGRIAAVQDGSFTLKETPGLYVGVPEMSALPRHLAAELDVRSASQVTRLDRDERGWTLQFESEPPSGPFAQVLVTAPADQTAALLDGLTPLAETVRNAEHQACWAALISFENIEALPFDGAFLNDDRLPNGSPNPLAWASREASKPGRPGSPERWTLHAKAEWSDAHVDRDPADVLLDLLAAFTALMRNATGRMLPRPVYQHAHRWRYAQVRAAALTEGEGECLYDPAIGAGAAGDWCVGGRIEGAFLSGAALGRRVIDELAASRSNAR